MRSRTACPRGSIWKSLVSNIAADQDVGGAGQEDRRGEDGEDREMKEGRRLPPDFLKGRQIQVRCLPLFKSCDLKYNAQKQKGCRYESKEKRLPH